MDETDIQAALTRHIEDFAQAEVDFRPWSRPPSGTRLSGFEIAEIHPGTARPFWSFLTMGCWKASPASENPAEFILAANSRDGRHAEIVAMAANYHCDVAMELASIVPLGEPWIEASDCDHLLIALPYPYGPDLEAVQGTPIRYRWLLPITAAEAAFGRDAGIEELERVFDQQEIDFANPARASAI